MLSAHVFNIFLRGEGTDGFINNMGWVYIGISVFNILINLAIVLIDSIYETGSEYLEKRQQEKKLKFIQERRENRQKIVDEAPGQMKVFEFELTIFEVLVKVKEWMPHRKWLKSNGIEFDDYPEEIEF